MMSNTQIDPTFPSNISPVALVTGGAKRVGAEVVKFLAERGLKVVIHCNSSIQEAENLSQELQSKGCETAVVSIDLADSDGPERLINFVYERFSGLGVLVNNASAFFHDDVSTFSKEGWDQNATTNLLVPVKLIQLFAKKLTADSGAKGCVVNMLDRRVLAPSTEFTAYTLAKTSLWTYTRMSAAAYLPALRVNGVGVGLALPGKYMDQKRFEERVHELPLQEGSSPDEIARAVWSLISLKTVTGQIINLDGGLHLK